MPSAIQKEPEEYLTPLEVAKIIKRSTSTLRRWRKTGRKLPFIEDEGFVLYRLSDIERWATANLIGGGEA